jgi:putative ABC transport system permease protein
MKPWWQLEGSRPQSGAQALVGARVAELLGVSVGSEVRVGGQTFEVVAVLAQTGQQDDDMLFVDLQTAQQALGRSGAISLVEVAALCIACPIEDMVAQIQTVLPQARVTALRQAVTLRMEMVGQLRRFSWALSAVVLIIGGLVVLTTMLGAVTERKQEIGVLRAIGYRQRHIINVILSEALLVSALGGVLGWLAGTGAAMILTPMVTQVDLTVSWDAQLALWSVAIAAAVGVLSSVYPALRAAQLDPTTALRAL